MPMFASWRAVKLSLELSVERGVTLDNVGGSQFSSVLCVMKQVQLNTLLKYP